MDAAELLEIKASIIEDLVERYKLSSEEAMKAMEDSSIDGLILKHPFHVRHYPIEMLSDKVWSLTCQREGNEYRS